MNIYELEQSFKSVSKEVTDIVVKIQAFVTCLNVICGENERKHPDFISEMQMKQSTLLRLIDKVNDIAMRAMAIDNKSLYYRCEDLKLEVRNTMETVRNLYM